MSIAIPSRFLDYVLFYECGLNERKTNTPFLNIGSTQPGALLSAVNWNSSGNNVGDGMGVTRFGVTPIAIQAYKKWSGNKGFILNSASAWVQMVNYFWKEACADQAANTACACIMCQGRWGGWSNSSVKNTCNELRNKCDKKDQAASITGNGYSSMAKLTYCFSNPMDAFLIIRSCRISYLRSCSNASKFAGGWMRREFFAMQDQGLYCEPGTQQFTKYGRAPLSQMEAAAAQLKKDSSSGYVKLMSWDGTPSSNIDLSTIDDGSNGPLNTFDGIDSNGGFYTVGHGDIIDGGILDMSKVNPNNKKNGLIVGMTINQK